MLYTEGTLVAEDRTLRKIARSNVNTALRSLETKTTRIVDALVNKLTSQTENFGTVDRLLELVLAHPQLATETTTIERYVGAFPELKETVTINAPASKTASAHALNAPLPPSIFSAVSASPASDTVTNLKLKSSRISPINCGPQEGGSIC